MEDVINKIIELDNNAKNKISVIKEKQENIEIYINKALEKEKQVIDNKFLYKKKNMQEKYNTMFEERKNKLDEEKNKKIEQIRQKYDKSKQQILTKLLEGIKGMR